MPRVKSRKRRPRRGGQITFSLPDGRVVTLVEREERGPTPEELRELRLLQVK